VRFRRRDFNVFDAQRLVGLPGNGSLTGNDLDIEEEREVFESVSFAVSFQLDRKRRLTFPAVSLDILDISILENGFLATLAVFAVGIL
jgi:hypothetical protein